MSFYSPSHSDSPYTSRFLLISLLFDLNVDCFEKNVMFKFLTNNSYLQGHLDPPSP